MRPGVSIIITSYHEKQTIGRLIASILDPKQENTPKESYEILLVTPDKNTAKEAQEVAKKYSRHPIVWIKDQAVGKPDALNLAFKKAAGDIFILTDGDVELGGKSIPRLISALQTGEVGGVAARVVSKDTRNSFFGYIGHLLADSAHNKRLKTNGQFPMSGYLMAIRKPSFSLPPTILSDDAYISFMMLRQEHAIVYEPRATVLVSYPKHIIDWYRQKARSLGGYLQLERLGFSKKLFPQRTFFGELSYLLFPLTYAKSAQEFVWSLALYPMRLYLWVRVFVEQHILQKSFSSTWVEVESTKN